MSNQVKITDEGMECDGFRIYDESLIRALKQEESELLKKIKHSRELDKDFGTYKNLIRALTEVTALKNRELDRLPSEKWENDNGKIKDEPVKIYIDISRDNDYPTKIYVNGVVRNFKHANISILADYLCSTYKNKHVEFYVQEDTLGKCLINLLKLNNLKINMLQIK